MNLILHDVFSINTLGLLMQCTIEIKADTSRIFYNPHIEHWFSVYKILPRVAADSGSSQHLNLIWIILSSGWLSGHPRQSCN